MPVLFSETHCTACGECVELCPGDIIRLSKGDRVPTVPYQDECWFCGACVHGCPEAGAIWLELPAALRV